MSTNGYTRQSLADIQTGLTIAASDLNNEFNQLQTAFDNTLGHDHSGAVAGAGQKINLGTSVSGILPVLNGGTGVTTKTGTGAVVLDTSPTISSVVVKGGETVSGGLTVSTGGIAVVAGGLTVSAGGIFDGAGVRVVSNNNKFGATSVANAGALTTTSLTGVMMGYGATTTIVPNVTGRIFVCITGMINNNTADDGTLVTAKYDATAAPVNGAAIVGTTVSFTEIINNTNTASTWFSFTTTGIVTGLSLGSTYWLDVALAALTGGTASIENVRINAIEI